MDFAIQSVWREGAFWLVLAGLVGGAAPAQQPVQQPVQQTPDPPAPPTLAEQRRSTQTALAALHDMGPAGRPALDAVLEVAKRDPKLRLDALVAIGAIGSDSKAAVAFLVQQLMGGTPPARAYAGWILSLRRSHDALVIEAVARDLAAEHIDPRVFDTLHVLGERAAGLEDLVVEWVKRQGPKHGDAHRARVAITPAGHKWADYLIRAVLEDAPDAAACADALRRDIERGRRSKLVLARRIEAYQAHAGVRSAVLEDIAGLAREQAGRIRQKPVEVVRFGRDQRAVGFAGTAPGARTAWERVEEFFVAVGRYRRPVLENATDARVNRACAALHMAGGAVVPHFVAALATPEKRAIAALGLWACDPDTAGAAVAPLLRHLGDEDPFVRQAVARALGGLGAPALAALGEELEAFAARVERQTR